jgi:hypothetical protein
MERILLDLALSKDLELLASYRSIGGSRKVKHNNGGDFDRDELTTCHCADVG